MTSVLSKSSFIAGQQCEKLLWFVSHDVKSSQDIDDSTKDRLKAGEKVGNLAKEIFPSGIEIDFEDDIAKMTTKTNDAIVANKTIYEATFLIDDILIRVDLMTKTDDGWNMYEVKSSSTLKSYHKDDASFQWYALSKVPDLKMNKAFVITIDSNFIKDGNINLKSFFHQTDLTDYANEMIAEMPSRIEAMRNTLKLEIEPNIEIGPQCSKPHVCQYKNDCWGINEGNSILNLYRLKSKDKFHGVSKFNVNTGVQEKSKSNIPSYTKVFANTLVRHAEKDSKIVGITAAMPSGTGMDIFGSKFPSRTFDVGIAEQHAVTFAAGLATEGFKPYAAIYSTFLQRAYDQVVHDVAIQSLPVRFAIDRAGLVGADGPTHAGSFDITYLSTLPNFVVMAASDESELVKMINTSIDINDRPSAFRYPRGNGVGIELPNINEKIEIGKGRLIKEGKKVAIINFGARLNECLIARENLLKKGVNITLVDARFAKPLDENLIWQIATDHEVVITIEEGSIGGFGSHVGQFLNEKNLLDNNLKFRSMFLPDRFIDHDKPEIMYKYAGLDSLNIESKILDTLNSKVVIKKSN